MITQYRLHGCLAFGLCLIALMGQSCTKTSSNALPKQIDITWPDTLAIPPLTTIVQPAGELPYYQLSEEETKLVLDSAAAARFDYLPCPGNVGILQPGAKPLSNIQCVILATRLPAGTQLQIQILGLCILSLDYGEKTYVIGAPIEPAWRVIQAENYQDLSTRYDPVRTLLQTYLVQKEGLGKVSRVVWQSEQFARKFLSDMYLEQ